MISVNQDIIELSRKNPGEKIQPTGKRPEKPGQKIQPTGKRPEISLFQSDIGYCALNSLLNLTTIPPYLIKMVKGEGSSYPVKALATLTNTKSEWPVMLTKVKDVQDVNLLSYLVCQEKGTFILAFQGHCISYDTKRGLIPTDPKYPNILEFTELSLSKLEISKLDLVYLIEKRHRK
jgi:hypothetical protein